MEKIEISKSTRDKLDALITILYEYSYTTYDDIIMWLLQDKLKYIRRSKMVYLSEIEGKEWNKDVKITKYMTKEKLERAIKKGRVRDHKYLLDTLKNAKDLDIIELKLENLPLELKEVTVMTYDEYCKRIQVKN